MVEGGGGLRAGASFALDGSMTIGRSPAAEIQIDDQFASGRHARIYERDGVCYLEDMGSTNGTYLNGQRGPVAGAPARRRQDPHRRHRVPVRAVTVAIGAQEHSC